jgi:hypothetical protein
LLLKNKFIFDIIIEIDELMKTGKIGGIENKDLIPNYIEVEKF